VATCGQQCVLITHISSDLILSDFISSELSALHVIGRSHNEVGRMHALLHSV